jgi:hypothetical protein
VTGKDVELQCRLRKIIKTRGHFTSDDAASKLTWLALRNITAVAARQGMEAGDEPVRDTVRRGFHPNRLWRRPVKGRLNHEYMGSTGAPPAAWQVPEDKVEISQQPIQQTASNTEFRATPPLTSRGLLPEPSPCRR